MSWLFEARTSLDLNAIPEVRSMLENTGMTALASARLLAYRVMLDVLHVHLPFFVVRTTKALRYVDLSSSVVLRESILCENLLTVGDPPVPQHRFLSVFEVVGEDRKACARSARVPTSGCPVRLSSRTPAVPARTPAQGRTTFSPPCFFAKSRSRSGKADGFLSKETARAMHLALIAANGRT